MNKKPVTPRNKRVKVDSFNVEAAITSNILADIKFDIKHKNETQKKLTQAIKKNDVTICLGPAGTGKTLLSVFEALTLIKNNPETYKEIKLVKSITQLRDEDLGTLPGDEKEKLKFQMMSFLDAFYKLIGEGNTNKLIDANIIKFEVFGSIRGRSFENAIIIIDEFQNITHDNAKTFLTRFSDNTKVIVLGDSGQIDLKNKSLSSLERLAKRVNANVIDGVSVVEFNESDVVRHRLTSYFINMFKEPIEVIKTKEFTPRPIIQAIPKLTFLEKIKKFFYK